MKTPILAISVSIAFLTSLMSAAPGAVALPDLPLISSAGLADECKCCIQGPVDICRACAGPNCTCDFDAHGLPRCTSGEWME